MVLSLLLLSFIAGTFCDNRDIIDTQYYPFKTPTTMAFPRYVMAGTIIAGWTSALMIFFKFSSDDPSSIGYPYLVAVMPLLVVLIAHVVIILLNFENSCVEVYDSNRINPHSIMLFYAVTGLFMIAAIGTLILVCVRLDDFGAGYGMNWYYVWIPMWLYHAFVVFLLGFYVLVFWSDDERGGLTQPTMRYIFWSWTAGNFGSIAFEILLSHYLNTFTDGVVEVAPDTGIRNGLVFLIVFLSCSLPQCLRSIVVAATEPGPSWRFTDTQWAQATSRIHSSAALPRTQLTHG